MPRPKSLDPVAALAPVKDARGVTIFPEPGPCLWCGEYVDLGRVLAGATRPDDPCWHADGDFGCDRSPDTSGDGCGDHARPWDLALRLMREREAWEAKG